MDKQYIIDEIRRTAEENNCTPLGVQRFPNETGINKSDWFPHYWLRWGDAIEEAGFSRNEFGKKYEED